MANPNTADIRPYLTSTYSDEEITVLCADYFRSTDLEQKLIPRLQYMVDHFR